ncbi:hypothetical protein EJP75_15625 [Acinetobacter baumannii]|nr:hypothetical protein EJP75_15625 [Acinetobacter baumannii]
MRPYYLKNGNEYMHIETDLFEDYQDYSDISAMYNQKYIFSEKKEGAKEFHTKDDAERYLTLYRRKLKGFVAVTE